MTENGQNASYTGCPLIKRIYTKNSNSRSFNIATYGQAYGRTDI